MSVQVASVLEAPSYRYTLAVSPKPPKLLDIAVDHSASIVPSASQHGGPPSMFTSWMLPARYEYWLWNPVKSLPFCEPKVAMAIESWTGELPGLPSGLQQCPRTRSPSRPSA